MSVVSLCFRLFNQNLMNIRCQVIMKNYETLSLVSISLKLASSWSCRPWREISRLIYAGREYIERFYIFLLCEKKIKTFQLLTLEPEY